MSISGVIVYYQAPKLPDRTHTIDITVTVANDITLFALDQITIVPTGAYNITMTPSTSSTSKQPTTVGAIVGGVVGGIAIIGIIAILVILVYYILNRTPVRQDNEAEKPRVSEILATECLYNHLSHRECLEFT